MFSGLGPRAVFPFSYTISAFLHSLTDLTCESSMYWSGYTFFLKSNSKTFSYVAEVVIFLLGVYC